MQNECYVVIMLYRFMLISMNLCILVLAHTQHRYFHIYLENATESKPRVSAWHQVNIRPEHAIIS
jgi:hypothetical protein